MTRTRLIILLVFIAACLITAYILYSHRTPSQDVSLKTSGVIEATTVTASFKVGGRVEKRFVDEGATVTQGQLLSKLETKDIEQELELRKSDLRAGEAQLSELEAGSRKEEISQAQAALERIQAEEKRLIADFARQEELFKREVISTRDFEAARTALLSVQAQSREARERLRLIQSGARPETIRQSRARRDSLNSAVNIAQQRLSDTVLTSPINGAVTAKHVEPGELVAPGAPVVTISDLENLFVRAYIPETEIGKLKLGQRVAISCDTFRGKTYNGVISFISQETEFTPKNVQTEKERVKLVFRIKISVPNKDRELKPGMPVDVEISVK